MGRAYTATFIVIGVAYAAAAVLAFARGRARALWTTWAAATAVLLGLGAWDWVQLSNREAPFMAYALAAALPAAGASGFVQWSETQRYSRPFQAIGAVVAFGALLPGVALLGLATG